MDYLQQLTERYPQLIAVKENINTAFNILSESFANNGKLLIAGNGGSAADAEHIVGELMKGFVKNRKLPDSFITDIGKIDTGIADYITPRLRPALPAISLSGHNSLNTACINDIDGNIIFAQQVYGYGKEGDVFLGISTSGNSKNILYAAGVARVKKMKVIALTGAGGGKLTNLSDVSICVPETETWKIQELHMPVYHCLCLMLEERFF
ncbi:MAG: SIS domain-containing protein [Treponema sp.]|nr:SIS domain-containing protein [Treponema sp.]